MHGAGSGLRGMAGLAPDRFLTPAATAASEPLHSSSGNPSQTRQHWHNAMRLLETTTHAYNLTSAPRTARSK